MKHIGNVMGGETAEVLAEDLVLAKTCDVCSGELTVRIPAGTLKHIAARMAKFTLICEGCSDKAEAVEELERARMLRRKHVDRCLMPGPWRALTWESYDTSRRGASGALASAKVWARRGGSKPGLLIAGP
ncbi:MAG TPA: hypothetical protein VK631_23665, partial [Solirubrobacteraceae bacterium]|nr:hypothetical protein [Solirubrobacteraceae bacterium]